MKKAFRAAGLVIAGVVVGLLAGVYLGTTLVSKPFRELSALSTMAWAGHLADLQYKEAGYAEARQALENYIAVLQSAVAHPELEFTHTAHFDLGLAYTRLALLAEANGKPEESPALMARAADEARAGGFRDPSPEHLRALVLRLSPPVTPTPKPGA